MKTLGSERFQPHATRRLDPAARALETPPPRAQLPLEPCTTRAPPGAEIGRSSSFLGLIESIEGRAEDILYLSRQDGGAPVAVHPNAFHEMLETVPCTGWQVQQDEHGLSILLAGICDPLVCETLASALHRMIDARGATVETIRVRAVDVLQRGPTGKAPLILKIGTSQRAEARE